MSGVGGGGTREWVVMDIHGLLGWRKPFETKEGLMVTHTLDATELYIFKRLIVCCENFTSIWKNTRVSAYSVLWISGWQRSWDSVRRGNLPNVTEVKRKKKTRCTSFSSSGSWFLGVIPKHKNSGQLWIHTSPIPACCAMSHREQMTT